MADRDIAAIVANLRANSEERLSVRWGRTPFPSAYDILAVLDDWQRQADEIAQLRAPMDAYNEDGEPMLPRGWVPVDGGRLDEAAEAETDALRAQIPPTEECDSCGEERVVAWWYENGQAPICAACLEAELLERDAALDVIARLRRTVNVHSRGFDDACNKLGRMKVECDAALAEVEALRALVRVRKWTQAAQRILPSDLRAALDRALADPTKET